MEFLGKIGVDFKLLIAQIINFLVLLWLLKILLYKPILKRLEERAKKAREIEEKEREIQKRKAELQKRIEEMIEKTKEKTKEILQEAKEISAQERAKILERTEKKFKASLKSSLLRPNLFIS